MKKLYLILAMCFATSAFAQDVITFEWKANRAGNNLNAISIKATKDEQFTIDWGDGSSIQTFMGLGDKIDVKISHFYYVEGAYTVTITASTQSCNFLAFDSYFHLVSDKYQQLIHLDVGNCSSLTAISCMYNQLESLNLGAVTTLTYLNCLGNQLVNLDVSNNLALNDLWCGYNKLTNLNLSNNTELTLLDCYHNKISNLDLSNNANLLELSCGNNLLSNLDLTYNTVLKKIACHNNLLTNLDVSNNIALQSLFCSDNQLNDLFVNDNANLIILDCSNNHQLNSLNITNSNSLESLYVGNCTILEELDCSYKQIKDLYVTGCVALTYLYCSNNRLDSLDISTNNELVVLDCSNNKISNLNLSSKLLLRQLYCSNNQLSSLNFSLEQTLDKIECYNNSLLLSNLFNISEMVDEKNNKLLGSQIGGIFVAMIGDTLFADQSVFNGVYTNYVVTKNGNPAPETDYSVVDGKLILNVAGAYNVVMTNDAIISHPDCPAKVVIELMPPTYTIRASSIGRGKISPEGAIIVPHGESQTFEIAGAIGCSRIKHLWIDGEDELPFAIEYYTYTFTDITVDHTIVAEFEDSHGVDENEYSYLFIYPNPTNGELQITNYELRIMNYELQLFDVMGRKQKAESRRQNDKIVIDISHLHSGIYFLKIDNQIYKIIKN